MDNIRRTVLYCPWIIYRTVLYYDHGNIAHLRMRIGILYSQLATDPFI